MEEENPRHSWKRKTLGLATYILKSILMQKKEELWKLKYFTMPKYNLPQKKIL
jgi:hypothetical protein